MLLLGGLYSLGFMGFILNRRHVLLALLSIELMLLSTTLLLLMKAHSCSDTIGLVLGIYALVIAGSESAIGLSIVVAYQKGHGQIYLN